MLAACATDAEAANEPETETDWAIDAESEADREALTDAAWDAEAAKLVALKTEADELDSSACALQLRPPQAYLA